MRRNLTPEILDDLAPEDPAARASRRDLQRINRLMRQAPISASLIGAHGNGQLRRVADLGCGDGISAMTVLRRKGQVSSGAELVLVDARPSVAPDTIAALEALGWSVRIDAADVFEWLARQQEKFDLTMSNLFLHHFEDRDLERLLKDVAAQSSLFIATEPLRTKLAYLAARAVRVIGANAVTRHDAPVSVRAGFNGEELGRIWPGAVLFEGKKRPFTHAFAARGTMQ